MNIRRLFTIPFLSMVLLFGCTVGPAARMPAANAASDVQKGWEVKEFAQSDNRTFFARVPVCAPANDQACVDYMGQSRSLIIYAHAADYPEDRATAEQSLNGFASLGNSNSIYAYAVSKDATKRWDSGICCTFKEVDDVGYLARLVEQIDVDYSVNRQGVGMIGDSNGGMLSHKAACERPDVFKAASSFAGTYTGPCNKQGVTLAQWHGGADNVVPVNGGDLVLDGRVLTFPPASAIATRMNPGSYFVLTVEPGLGHSPYWWIWWQELHWMAGRGV